MAKNSNEGTGNSAVKIVLIVLGSLGVCLLVCCGGGYWAVQRFAGKMMATDPDQVRTMTAEMSSIEIPAAYEPKMGMDMSGFGVPMKMVMYVRGQSEQPALLLMQAPDDAGGKGMTREDFEQAMTQQGQGQNIQVTERELRVFDFAGEEYTFEFVSGTGGPSGGAAKRASGVFPASGGLAFLTLFDTEENWDDEAVMQMIASTGGTYVRTEESESPEEQSEPDANSAEPNAEPAAEEAASGDAAAPTEEDAPNADATPNEPN